MTDPKRTTKQHPNECKTCEGFGDTEETRAVMNTDETKTLKQGSGCPKCLGTGRLP